MLKQLIVVLACVGLSVQDKCSKQTLIDIREAMLASTFKISNAALTVDERRQISFVKCTAAANGASFEVVIGLKSCKMKIANKVLTFDSPCTTMSDSEANKPCENPDKQTIDDKVDVFIGWDVKIEHIVKCTKRPNGDIDFTVRHTGDDGIHDITGTYIPGANDWYVTDDYNVSFVGDMDLFEALGKSGVNDQGTACVEPTNPPSPHPLSTANKKLLTIVELRKLAATVSLKANNIDVFKTGKLVNCFVNQIGDDVNIIAKFSLNEDYCGLDYRSDGRGDWWGCVDIESTEKDDFRRRVI